MPSDLTTTPISADLVRGAVELEPTAYGVLPHRLPAAARRWADAQLAFAESQPSGVRLAFRTRASRISLETVPTKQVYAGAPPRPDGVYDLVVDGRLAAQGTARGGHTMTVDMVTGRTELTPGEPVTVDFDDLGDHEKDVEVWLPWNERTELVALHADAPVAPAAPGSRLWLHHGSSISHGSDTASPTGTWPAVAASLAGVDLLNLGFGGSALLDPFVARAIRDLPADLISLKLGINVVNHDAMRLRAFTPAVHGFLDTIREGRPTTPLLLVSPICCPIHEETPGPTEMDLAAFGEGRLGFRAGGDPAEVAAGRLTLSVIRRELADVVAQRDDPNLAYLDGLELYGAADATELPLPDDLHPGPEAHRRIGERFAALALSGAGAWAPAD
ncbi:MAG TPA: GDSL-type esterase/lipase family protein [Nocardioides sp.]|nr:GDSL-type esterase/lipase family protein [Nocardioides sp.]